MDNHPTDLLEAYALRLLSPASEQEVAAHLADCPQCRAEVAALEETFPLLAYAAPPQQPPADLEDRLMARIGAIRRAEGPPALRVPSPSRPLRPVAAPPAGPARTAPRRALPWVGAVGAVAAILVAALVVTQLLRPATAPLSLHDRLVQQARAALHDPTAPVATLTATAEGPQGAVAVLATDPATNQGVLVVGDMPTLMSNQTYQFWLVHPGTNDTVQTTSAGTFTVAANGIGELDFTATTLATLRNAGISVERAGGVAQPDSPMLMLLSA